MADRSRSSRRLLAWTGAVAVVAVGGWAACQPTATVRRTVPVAKLETYRSIIVRAQGVHEAGGLIPTLEVRAADRLRAGCRFDDVRARGQHGDPGGSDLLLDLNIQRSYRGGDGFIKNLNLATVDVLLVLSDGASEDLLGSAWIRGQSSQMAVSGRMPEDQALDAVVDKIGEVMVQAGCGSPRVDRPVAETPAPPPASASAGDAGAGEPATAVDPKVQKAEALNDDGKRKFREADVAGSAELFRQAIALVPDPRYYFNLCFAYETLKQWDAAIGACNDVLARNPTAELAEKTRTRIQTIRDKQSAPAE
jgi:hypothetical protein